MDFSEVSARFKKMREDQAPPAPAERNYEEIHALRARILGVLIRDARLAHGTSQAEVSRALQVSEHTVRDWEYGESAPSLPQLELLAFFLGIPVSHFWSNKTLQAQQEARSVPPVDRFIELRDRIIGVRLALARKEARLSPDELAAVCGLTPEQIAAYESGQQSIPFPKLTSLAIAVRQSISYFLEDTSRLGSWLALQEEFRKFSELSDEVRDFVTQVNNQPFVEIAMILSRLPSQQLRLVGEIATHLSQLPVEDLRTVGEKILDITL